MPINERGEFVRSQSVVLPLIFLLVAICLLIYIFQKNERYGRFRELVDTGDKKFVAGDYGGAAGNYMEAIDVDDGGFYSYYSLALANMARAVGYEYVRYESGFKKWWYGEKRITRKYWGDSNRVVIEDQLRKAYDHAPNEKWRKRIQESIEILSQEPPDTHVKYFLGEGKSDSSGEFSLIR